MRSLKEDLKKYQAKMKELRDKPDKLMAEQKKMMAINMEMMKHSMKPTLYYMIPLLIVFGWLAGSLSVMPVSVGSSVNITAIFDDSFSGEVTLQVPEGLIIESNPVQTVEDSKASWSINAEKEATYRVLVDYDSVSYPKEVRVSSVPGYTPSVKGTGGFFDFIYGSREGTLPSDAKLKRIIVGYDAVKPLPFSIFGWEPGWLGTYIIFSILFSIILRKLLKVV